MKDFNGLKGAGRLKDFVLNHKKIIAIVLCLIVFGMLLDAFFKFDMKFKDDMSKELKVISECGSSAGMSSYVSVINDSGISEFIDETVIRNGDTDGSRLAITCNVDWGEDVIPDILDTLEENNVRITFFVTGKWAEKNPRMLRTMYLKGHEIQSHGYGHKLCSQVTESEVRSEIEKTSDILHNLIGVRPDIFAPPSGDFDSNTVRICRDMGLKLSLWSADTIDWRDGSTSDVIYDRIMSKELNGAIILMHPKEETAKALPRLLSAFKDKKLEAVTLSELIAEK